MKILVDKMPTDPSECPHSVPGSYTDRGQQYQCEYGGRYDICLIGRDEKFKCPYYREFNAMAVEEGLAASNTNVSFRKSTPVVLEDE